MELFDRISGYLRREHGKLPWSCGFIPDKASEKAASAWEILSQEERLMISRYSPFKRVRNQLICDLHRLGLTQAILSELSGIPQRTIEYITARKKRKA